MIQANSTAAAFSPTIPPHLCNLSLGLHGSYASLTFNKPPKMVRPIERHNDASISMTLLPFSISCATALLATSWTEAERLIKPKSETMDLVQTQEIERRLQFLKIEADADDIPFSDASLTGFQTFMNALKPQVRPALFLNDNGNLRALWKNSQREQVGLEFLGVGNIQFVIFKLQKGTTLMIRNAGVDSLEKILNRIRSSGAEGLFF